VGLLTSSIYACFVPSRARESRLNSKRFACDYQNPG
jgi:hypothetical protein